MKIRFHWSSSVAFEQFYVDYLPTFRRSPASGNFPVQCILDFVIRDIPFPQF